MTLIQLVSALNWCMTLLYGVVLVLFAIFFVPKIPLEATLLFSIPLLSLTGLHAYLALSIDKYRGRILQTLVGVLSLANFPIGTIYGALALWVCWAGETASRFENPEAWAFEHTQPEAEDVPPRRRDESAYAYASRLARRGLRAKVIEFALEDAGLSDDEIETTMGALERNRAPPARRPARRS